jgi:hypothetical protein
MLIRFTNGEGTKEESSVWVDPKEVVLVKRTPSGQSTMIYQKGADFPVGVKEDPDTVAKAVNTALEDLFPDIPPPVKSQARRIKG